ncbi:aminoglycoside phosphotransferase family protein [Actinomadura alba]
MCGLERRCDTVGVTLLEDLARAVPADGEPVVLSTRRGVLVLRAGDVVVKAHRPGTGEADLRDRMSIAADPLLSEILVPPMGPLRRIRDRWVTVWPAGRPVDPAGHDEVPWADGARLLARLHALPIASLATGPPSAGGPARVARAVAGLPDGNPAADQVRQAYEVLPGWARGEADALTGPRHRALVHGDWHLGQLIATPGAGWRLIDIDDLGVGDPVWDLARPAALYAAGVLPPADWETFLGAYRASGGYALPADGDPWPRLNVPAQALAVQLAATCVATAAGEDRPLDEDETALVRACGRIAAMSARL